MRLHVPGRFGRKGRLGAQEIAKAVKTTACAEAKRVGWKTPPRAKLSVSLLFGSSDRSAPAIHNLVKFYLDELRGVAFVDDRQISHLTAGFFRAGALLPDPTTTSDVCIAIERLVHYNRRFDLCFELFDRYGERERESSEHALDFEEIDESLLATFPEETRRQMKKIQRNNVQERLLSHSKLGCYDRPGVHRYMRNLVPTYEDLRKSHPLVIELGELPQRPGDSARYKAGIRTQIQQFKKNHKIFEPIGVPLDMDVRVGSHTLAAQKDLDNIMRDITPIVAGELFGSGSFLNEYRIYVSDVMDQSGMANQLEVKFLPMGAIRRFDNMIYRTLEEAEESF